ncbi:ABC transporter ATP-binding protein [Streptomyces sp. NPDC055189]
MTASTSSGSAPGPLRRGLLGWLLWSHPLTLLGYLATALLLAGSGLLIPAFLGEAVNAALGKGGGWQALVPLCALLATATLAEFLSELLEVTTRTRAQAGLRRVLTEHLVRLDLAGQRRYTSGDMLNRLLESAGTAALVIPTGVSALVSLLTAVGGVVALAVIDIWTGAVFCLGAPLVWAIARGFLRRSSALTRDYQRVQSEITGRLLEAVGGHRTIRAAGTVEREVRRVLAPLPRLRAAGLEFWRVQRDAGWQIGVILPVLNVAVLCTAGTGLLNGRLAPGQMLAVTGYLAFAGGIFRQVNVAAMYGRVRGSADRVEQLLALPVAAAGNTVFPAGGGEVRLHGAGAHDPATGATLLEDITLTVPAGTTVAVVGASGSGKSTLAALIGNLRRPDTGRVTIDGVDTATAVSGATAEVVSYAFERPVLLGRTVGDALAYADRPPGAAAVTSGLRAGAADQFVHRLPRRLDTALEDLRISGGEAQRLGLARAFARETRVTVLDDALSSVDTATEARITRALQEQTGTRFLVTHRLSTASRAELVLWLEGGRIAGAGRHTDLLADPRYTALFHADAGPGPTRTES